LHSGYTPGETLGKALARALLRAYLRIAYSRTGIRLWGIARYPHPDKSSGWLQSTQLSLSLAGLPAVFDRYRIAQISDLHVGTWLDAKRLGQAVEQVNSLQPDLVVITGDFVTYHPEDYYSDIVSALGKLETTDGVLAVLGNHDHWADAAMVRDMISKAGAIDLSNRVHTLHRDGHGLNFAGVDCQTVGLDRLDLVTPQIPSGEPAILLVHEPDFALQSSVSGKFGLQLSGHSHGGQVNLPGVGLVYLPRLARMYPSGLYQVNGMHLYTNRGLGTAEIQVRVNCPAEITLIELTSPDPAPDQAQAGRGSDSF
jgi:predicted MPP superfamily phosphohydrolase